MKQSSQKAKTMKCLPVLLPRHLLGIITGFIISCGSAPMMQGSLCYPDTAIISPRILPDGAFQLAIIATNPRFGICPFRLQASTNFQDWVTLTNFPFLHIPPGGVVFTDWQSTNFIRRYYRVVVP